MLTVQVQLQLLTVAAGHITADTQGQRFATRLVDVAKGVAAQPFTDIGGDSQGAFAGFGKVQVFGTNTQRDRTAKAQRRSAQGQLDARACVQLNFSAQDINTADGAL